MNNQSSQGLGAGMNVRMESRHDDNGNELFPWMYIINNTIANNSQRMGDGNLNDLGAGLYIANLNGTVFVFNCVSVFEVQTMRVLSHVSRDHLIIIPINADLPIP